MVQKSEASAPLAKARRVGRLLSLRHRRYGEPEPASQCRAHSRAFPYIICGTNRDAVCPRRRYGRPLLSTNRT
jgi:hypothetical protein